MKSFYGFTKPYDFNRAFPFATATFFLLLTIGVMVSAALFGRLGWDTYRFWYFLYVGSIALIAAALSFIPKLAWSLIALCFLEISLGLGTAVLEKTHILKKSMLPLVERLSDDRSSEFRFHPLLGYVPTPDFLRLSPFKIQHDSYGLRGAERDRNRLAQKIVIAAVGGSTTYGLGVANGQTWPDMLERKLGDQYAVLNHGVVGYSTVENLIQTLFYLNSYNVKPQCAVYYEGWNDIHNAHLPNLDPAYANWHQLKKAETIRELPLAARISPLSQIAFRQLQSWIEIIPMAENLSDKPPGQGNDKRLENIFRTNLKAIAAINKQRGITSVFVGQLLNRALLGPGARAKVEWWGLVRGTDAWPLQAHFNKILEETAEELDIPAFIPPIDEFRDTDFVDQGHFSPAGDEKFVAMLEPVVRANCKKQ